MSVSWWCALIGLVLTAFGGALGLRGFLSTFRTYGGGQLLGGAKERLRAVRAWLRHPLRSTAADSGTFTENASVQPSLDPIDTARPPAMFVKDLQDQVARIDYGRGLNISALDQKIHRVALDGIRLQAFGLLLTITGGLLAGVPTLATSDRTEQITCQQTGNKQLRCTLP